MTSEPRPEWGEPHTRSITYWDHQQILDASRGITGLELLRMIQDGTIPPVPFGQTIGGMTFKTLEEGLVEIETTPDASAYNPIGLVHGGFASTLLDSVAGCAVHTTLPVGFAFSSIELKVNFLRPVHANRGPVLARGWVTKPGRRVAFAEAELLDSEGKKLATASSSCVVIAPPSS